MALFGSKEEKKSSAKKIRSVVVRTQNVAKELISLADSYGVNVKHIDFNILEVQTYIRVAKKEQDRDWEEVSVDALKTKKEYLKEYLNADFQIKQMYELEFNIVNREEEPYPDFHCAIAANASKCKIYLSIKNGSKITYEDSFEDDIRLIINKKKIRAGILINIFDDMMDEEISKLVAALKVQENMEFEKNKTILVAQGIEPSPTIHDKLVLCYEEKEEIKDNDRIDYSQRDYIHSVQKDEVLIKYIKAKMGEPGRNCRGEYIKPKEMVIENAPTFQIDDTISKVETEDATEYKAKENGYIAYDNNTYTIKTDMEVDEISFKATGSISSGLDSDVSLNVKEDDAVKDAVGTGMEVEVTEINIDGNVGSNAKVNAIKASVDGQVHKTAVVRAHELRININKGTAYGRDIAITRLEHGVVDGDKVNVSQAVGGSIRAKEITIELCGSYVHATASKFIEINKLVGQENVFIIDPLLKRDANNSLENDNAKIEEIEDDIKNIEKEIQKYEKLIRDNTDSFNNVKKKLIHYKKNNIKMPGSFVEKYKQFLKMEEHLENIQKEHKQKYDYHELLTTRIGSFQDSIFDARIINRDRWQGHNEIIFKLIDPPMEISYNPPEGSHENMFALVQDDDGNYQIQAVKE